MSASHSKVVVDHVGNLSYETDLLLELEFWMIWFRAEAIFASTISKFG